MLSRDYLLRTGAAVSVLATVLVLSSAVLLVPTYVFLIGNADAKKIELARIESVLSSSDEAELSERLAVLSANAASLASLSNVSSVSTLIRGILSISRPGVALSSISVASSKDNGSGTIIISGKSATRDSLRSYQLALQGSPFTLSAVLPVSAYAKDSDISFTITITLKPSP